MFGSAQSHRRARKAQAGIPESGEADPTAEPPESPSYNFSQHRRVSTVTGDLYFDVSKSQNIPRMAYTIPNKPKGPRPSLDDFEKRASTGSLFMRGKPTIVPIHPETGNRVEVNKLPIPSTRLVPNSPPAGRKTGVQLQTTSAKSSPALLPAKNEKSDAQRDKEQKVISELGNDGVLHKFNMDTLVIGEICGSNLSDISGIKPANCPRRGSVISNPGYSIQDRPTSQPGSRRPSIYAQLDELTSAENSTATPLYRTFTVPRASLVAQTSVELPSITIQVNTQTEEN